MKRKKIVSVIAIIMALLLVFSLILSAIPASAFAVSQEDIDALKSQREQISKQLAECKERLGGLQQQQANVLEQKAALMEANKLAQEQIDLNQAQIEIYVSMIKDQAEVVLEAKSKEDLQLSKYRTRVRAMEENGEYNILALLAQTDSLSELLAAVDDMGEIMESDRILEDQYIAAREETEKVKENYEAIKADYETKLSELQAEQDALRLQIDETNKQLESLTEQIEKALAEYKAKEAEEAAASAEISNMIAEWDRQKAAAAAAAAAQAVTKTVVNEDGTVTTVTETPSAVGVTGTGTLMWPVPSSMTITSRFGTRTDPFTGQAATHTGIDIDGYNREGQAVVAADSGTVVTATSNSGYGNYIIIDHGGMKTVYAHLSGFSVSAGQTVTQGQTIGSLGSTGRATGTHLHFEVYVGGSRVDPAAYFSGVSYYNC